MPASYVNSTDNGVGPGPSMRPCRSSSASSSCGGSERRPPVDVRHAAAARRHCRPAPRRCSASARGHGSRSIPSFLRHDLMEYGQRARARIGQPRTDRDASVGVEHQPNRGESHAHAVIARRRCRDPCHRSRGRCHSDASSARSTTSRSCPSSTPGSAFASLAVAHPERHRIHAHFVREHVHM